MIEVSDNAPETVIGVSAFRKEAVDVRVPLKRAAEDMEDAEKAGNKIFGFVQGKEKFFDDIGDCIKKAVKEIAVIKEELAEGLVDREDEMPVSTVDEFEGHGSRPVIGIFSAAGGAEFGMAAERDKFEITAVGTAIHGAAKRRVTAAYDFINVFHDNRSWF